MQSIISRQVISLIILMIVLVPLRELNAKEGVEKPTGKVTINLCLKPDASNVTKAWTRNVASALSRLSYAGYQQAGQLYALKIDKAEKCFELAGNACYGYRDNVYCDAEVLTRQLYAIATVSVGVASNVLADSKGKKKNHIQFKSAVNLIEGMELFDNAAAGNQQGFAKVIERITQDNGVPIKQVLSIMLGMRELQRYDADLNAVLDPEKQAVELLAYTIYEGASNYMIAYLLGHELAHAFSSCLHKEASRVENSRLFIKLATLQAEGKTLCPNVPQLDELRADQCGLRAAERMNREMINYKKSRYQDAELRLMMNLLSVSRRLAIDSLSLILTTGLGKRSDESLKWIKPGSDGIPTIAYVQEFRDGYLYTPIRLILFSSLMGEFEQNNKHIVRICDSTAQRFVMGVNMALVQCKPKDQDHFDHSKLPEAFGEFVPEGVVKGWKTGHWEDRDWESFKCYMPTSKKEASN